MASGSNSSGNSVQNIIFIHGQISNTNVQICWKVSRVIIHEHLGFRVGYFQHKRMSYNTAHTSDKMTEYTNEDLCRIPGHGTYAEVGLSGWWPEVTGRRPGVPEKLADALVPCHTYYAQILICFLAHTFYLSSCVWVESKPLICRLQLCLLRLPPLSVVIRIRLLFSQSSFSASLARAKVQQDEKICRYVFHRIETRAGRIDKILTSYKIINPGPSEWISSYLRVI